MSASRFNQALLTGSVAVVIGVVAASIVTLSSSDDASAPEQQAGPVGSYRSAVLPAASSPGRLVSLVIRSDGTLTMTTDFMGGRPVIVQDGRWAVSSDGMVQIRLESRNGAPLSNAVTSDFKIEGGALKSVGSPELYGSAGLTLYRE